MKKKGRILAFLLAMVMMFTEVSTAWAASGNEQDYSTVAEESDSEESKEGQGASLNASAEGEGSVGSLLADDLQKEFTRTQAEAYINGLTVEGQTVTVSYLTNMKADLVAGIFTEDGKQLMASGHVSVEPSDQTSVQITLSDMPPQYFRASAYLLDPETREPICEAYNSQYYTKDIQDLMSKTSEDFEDTGRLVYLDTGVVENQNQNFAVYNEGTVVFDENGKTDILTKNADGTWTFANASAKAKALKAGDVIAYNYKDGLMDAVRVKKVDKKGNTVIVTPEDEIRLEDIFEHLKIHSDGGMKVKGVDTSGMSEYLTYRGLTDGDTEEISVQSEDTDASVESVADMMGTPTAKLDISGKYSTWSFKGNLKLSFESAAVDVALSWKSSYIQVYMDWNLIYSLTFEGTTDGEWDWNMMELTFSPVVGCYIVVAPAICIEVSGSIDVSGKLLGGRIGIMYDGSRNDISRGPTLEKMKLQASIFIGMKFKVAVTILDKIEKLKSELSISVKVGGEFAVSGTIPLDSGKGKTKHTCKQCLSIKIKLKLSVTLKLDVINDAVKTQVTLTTISKDMGTFFYSLDYSGLGEGDCPHYLYKTSFVTVNRKADEVEEKRVQDANVSIKLLKEKEECDGKATKNEWSDSVQMTTDENGECSTLLAPGDYEAVFDKDSLTATVKFTVADECEEHKVLMEERVYSITYNIKDQKGIAQRGAEVTATDSKGEKQKVTADGSGKANLQLKGGAYDIEIHNGDLEKKFRTKVSRNLEMDIKLHGPAYKVTVTVTDESGNPVSDAGIAGLNSEKENVLDDSAVTGTDGKAEIYLENGDYTLQVTKTKGNQEGEVSVTVNGEEQEVSIVIYGKRTITVMVKDEAGNPLENAGVVAVNGDKRYDGISDKNGKAELVLGRGTWELTGTKDELKGTGSVTVEGEDKSVSLTLKEAEYEVMINFEVPEKMNSYTSYLFHVEEKIFNEDGQLVVSTLTNRGSHNEYLKKGRYLVMCTGMRYESVGGNHSYSAGTGKWIEVDGNTEVTIPVAESNIKLSQSGDTLYISGTGRLDARYWCYGAKVKKVVIGSGIEYINSGVFEWEENAITDIEEIIIPSSVKVIANGAFLGCSGLKNMTVPSSVCYIGNYAIGGSMMESLRVYVPCAERNMFYGQVKNLTIGSKKVTGDGWGGLAENIVLTDEVEEAYTSFGGSVVKTVTMGNSIKTELKEQAFAGCSNLQKVNLHKITIVPDYAFRGCISLAEIEIPETVSSIGKRAFAGCTGFTEIEIPEIVSAIGEGAFYGCSSLTRIATIGKGTFEGRTSLAEIEILENVSGIGEGAFEGCTSLVEIEIPENVSSIGKGAFEGCTSLAKIEMPENISVIGEGAFKGCISIAEIEIPKNVSDIGKSAFEGCSLLTEIGVIPEGVTEIKEQTFKDCTALKMAIVPESLITIKSKAFYNCISLESVKIPKNVQTIGYEAFRKCSSLKTVDMTEATVSKIDEFAFSETAIKKFTIPETVTTIKRILSDLSLEELTVLGCDGCNLEDLGATAKKIILNVPRVAKIGKMECETIIIGEKVKRIERDAFHGTTTVKEIIGSEHMEYLGYVDFSELTSLEELILPDEIDNAPGGIDDMPASLKKVKISEGFSTIWWNAFNRCTDLTEVQLPASITEIGFCAFENCKKLESVTFNENSHLRIIGTNAFYGCSALKKIALGNEVERIEADAFMGCTSLTEAVVPSGKSYVSGEYKKCFSTSWAFDECPNLEKLTLGSENVCMSANSTMTGLKEIILLDTVKEITKGTCPSVEDLVIPANVQTMATRAFVGWENLRKVTILGDKIVLPDYLFAGCSSLETVDIKGEVTRVEKAVFSGCASLKTVDQRKLLKHMKEVPVDLFYGCRSLTKAEIPDHITEIGSSAYGNCTGLTELELSDHITDIKRDAFEGCASLTEIDIPKSVERISDGAFYGCRNLKSVFIPASVTSLGEDAFDNRWIENICFEDMHTYYGGDILSIVYSSQGGDIDLRQEKDRYGIYYDRLDQVHAQMKSINIFYPAGQTVTEQDKEHLGLQFCTWIPYTGSLDDAETFFTSDEFQAVAGAEIFSDGNSETGTGTIESDAEEQTQPEEVIISDEEENIESGSSETADSEEISVEEEFDDSEEISVEEEFDDGDELVIHEFEKPVSEAAENFTSGSAVLELNEAGEVVSGVTQTQTYTGLVENSRCFFVVVRDKNAEDFFAASNLLFMTQAVSDEDGNLTVEYRTEGNTGIPILYGQEKSLDISDAEIIVEDGMIYTGKEQKPEVTVVCGGEKLTENKDYVLKGDVAATDAGTYKIRVVGRNPYRGSAEKEYQVAKAKQKISLGMMTRELTVGSKVNLKAAGIGTISYTSRQPDIVSADTNGVLTAKKAGVAAVVIQASGNKNYVSARKNVIVFVKKGTGNSGNTGGSGGTAQKPTVKKSVMKLNASSLVLQKKQKTSALAVSGMVSGDYVKSVVSGNKKLVKVVSFTKTGKIILQAQKKTGKTTLTIQLARGAKKTIKIKVQAGKVKTSKISISKKVRIKKGKKLTLKPALTPITSQEKVTFTSSNKKIATVTSKGVIKAKKPGKAKITVRSGRKKVTVTVTVTK